MNLRLLTPSAALAALFIAALPIESRAVTGPCDIYAAGNTPCTAAYSTVRALYGAYSGSLYQVRRADNTTKDIGVLSAGGAANSSVQDAFCSGSTCTISIIYDQSGNGNHLTKAPGGSTTYGPNDDVEAVADALPIYINGHKVYGVHVVGSSSWTSTGQVGYRNTATKGIVKGDTPESVYMVTDGTYYNGSCCFDFGNALLTPTAGANGSMDALYFGNCTWWDKGSGSGPWIMADLESGVYNMNGKSGATNSADISFTYKYVTAILKNNSRGATNGGPFTLKGGNAQSGDLVSIWDGARPTNYESMAKGGGVVLGIGGDNSSMARGNFFEGVMTNGYATTATDNALQANIIAARYGQTTTVSDGGSSSSSAASSSATTPSSSSAVPGSSSSVQAEIAYSEANIPGVLQMENYNEGGEGVAYHDADSANQGGVYRKDGVDIDTASNASTFALGWLVAGEWTHYVVNSTVLDSLTIYFRAARGGEGNGAFHLEIDGSPVSSSIVVQNTGSWTTYKTMTAKVSGLIPGSHILSFVVDSSYFNIDWIQFGGESPTGLTRPAALPANAPRTYKVFSATGRYLGSVNAREYADLRAAVMKKFPQTGLYVVEYVSGTGKVLQKFAISPLD